MAYFDVMFKFVDGKNKRFVKYESETYSHVAGEVVENHSGWFGTKGELVNLSNVTECRIIEVDEEGYMKS